MEVIQNPFDLTSRLNTKLENIKKLILDIEFFEDPKIVKIFERFISLLEDLRYANDILAKKIKCNECPYKDIYEFFSKMKHREDLKRSQKELYFIHSEKDLIKIGIAFNSKTRLKELQRKTKYKLKLLAIIPNQTRRKEKEVHKIFRKFRVFGEWFEAKPEIYNYINNIKNESMS